MFVDFCVTIKFFVGLVYGRVRRKSADKIRTNLERETGTETSRPYVRSKCLEGW